MAIKGRQSDIHLSEINTVMQPRLHAGVFFCASLKEHNMSRRRETRKSPPVGQTGPIQPGSLLYRVLQMIAREVAKAWEIHPPTNDLQHTRH
jgi:hypothetical protein